MYFMSGKSRAFEMFMQGKPGFDRYENGCTEHEDCNRLQIFFDGKPDEGAREELKANGFRWAPSVGAWQRQLNMNAYRAAEHISCIQPVTGDKPVDLQRNNQH